MIEYGYEVDAPGKPNGIRWWYMIHLDSGRIQTARQGVVDRGFRFARGGRVTSGDEAKLMLRSADEAALAEWRAHRFQPSHALGDRGELIPLDEVPLELRTGPARVGA